MPTKFALQRAAQAWCGEKSSSITMDTELAEEFAKIIDEICEETQGGLTLEQQVDRCKVKKLVSYVYKDSYALSL